MKGSLLSAPISRTMSPTSSAALKTMRYYLACNFARLLGILFASTLYPSQGVPLYRYVFVCPFVFPFLTVTVGVVNPPPVRRRYPSSLCSSSSSLFIFCSTSFSKACA